MALSAGDRLGPYEILAPLGVGGMGEVYRATDTKLGREVAVKVLPRALAANPDARRRFEREARTVAALSHPNILAIYDLGQVGDIAYAVMELLQGETLRQRLESVRLSPRKAVDFALQIARGLAAAHDKSVVHRDLKPENVFITTDGQVKILDFGLAKLTRPLTAEERDTDSPTLSRWTTPGTVMGTVGYMSPEQVRGRVVDHRSDLFAFGVVFYEMLAGRRAFAGLRKEGEDPAGMVRVPAGATSSLIAGLPTLNAFELGEYLIDRFEVSNRDYRQFVASGGYERPQYWNFEFLDGGHRLSWTEAMERFRDSTGRTGPATWELGSYPEGQADLPVTGVSWYEAAAYATFAGRSLPTIYHWFRAAGTDAASHVVPASNFEGGGLWRVGQPRAMSPYGSYDMAGNAREWCWNSTGRSGDERYLLGGAWGEPSYMFGQVRARSPFDRSPENGFRCAKYLAGGGAQAAAAEPVRPAFRDYAEEQPVSEETSSGRRIWGERSTTWRRGTTSITRSWPTSAPAEVQRWEPCCQRWSAGSRLPC